MVRRVLASAPKWVVVPLPDEAKAKPKPKPGSERWMEVFKGYLLGGMMLSEEILIHKNRADFERVL